MSKESTPVPILSYKKPLLRAPSAALSNNSSYLQLSQVSSGLASPNVSAPETPTLGATPTLGSTPTLGGTRKVSSRRKALQEFYKFQEEGANSEHKNENNEKHDNDKQNNENTEPEQQQNLHGIGITVSGPETYSQDIESLGEAQLDKYIKTASVEEMLKLRNQAASKLNHHDVEKKSIIYDNYYELIKLSQVLSNLDVASAKTNAMDMDEKPKVTDQYVNEVLGELQEFLAGEGTVFNQDFGRVADTIRSEMEDAESLASVRGIAGERQ